MTSRSTRPGKSAARRDDLLTDEIRFRTLAGLGSLPCNGLTLSRLLEELSDTVRRETGCTFVRIAADSPADQGRRDPSPGQAILAGVPLPRSILRAGRAVLVPPGARGTLSRRIRTLGLGNLAILPLRTGTRLKAIMAIGSSSGALSGRGDLRFLRQLALQIAARLREHEERRALGEESEKYRSLLAGIPDSVIILDPSDGTILEVNHQASRLTGIPPGALKGKSVFSLHPPASAEKHREALKAVRRSFGGYGPIEFLRSAGKPVPAEINARLLRLGERDVVLCVVRDISEKKRTEVKLAASEELLRIIVEGTLDMFFYVHDTAGVFTYLSPSVGKITGFPPEHWKSRHRDFLTDSPINDAVRGYAERALREGIAVPTYTCEVRHADGRPLLLEINEKPVLKEGTVIGLQGVARDITERKRLEEAILESRDNLNRILDQTPLAVTVLDARGNLIDVNEAWLRLFGAPGRTQVIGKLNVFHSAFIRGMGLAEAFVAVYGGETVDVPAITVDPRSAGPELPLAGVERTVHVRMFPVLERNGKLVNVVAMMEDVTDRRRLEEQLIQSQKMESIGLLAGGIAHDFNNILGGILGYASFVKAQVQRGDRIYPHLETIERSALRAAELTSQLLGFARGGKYVVGPLYINDLVTETADLLRGTIEKNIVVETRLDSSSPVVEADASQMQQVLMNLCVNARDAMPGGGDLTITTARLDRPDGFLRSVPDVQGGPFVRIDIADTGIGIDRAIRGKIFDPFFTTKEKGKGTGLGLATVYGIVKNHNGFINVESEMGEGTTFSVYIPAVDKAAAKAPEVASRPEGGQETILVVDDEETIRFLVRDILEEIGYNVLAAADGYQAVEMYRNRESEIDLVILDMTMPGMGGRETFEKLKELNPRVRAVLSTGYSEDERARQMLAMGVKAFVQKPYRIDDLASAVRRILESPST
ncbi:MAG TPA: PAS domain S-box protein [Bacteroidota bacterium]|nr:PAS domain S-box protein [Bacteroidota bacterium]